MFDSANHLRRVIFRPYRKGCGPAFTLDTWYTGRTRSDNGGAYIRYRLQSGGVVLFEGDDFGCGASMCVDSDDAIEALMGFLTLRPGDTDRDYFANYTPAQLEYCEQHAEALSMEVMNRFGQPA